jgi:formylglycine-generating enzyme required for sulfatase activity
MQWEAKYDRNGDGIGDTAAAAACPADAGLGLDWRDPGCNTASNIVSTPQGAPIVHITHTQAVSACSAIGARLLNNQTEWMPLARDAEQVPANWSTGVVGAGCLFRGNVGLTDACGYAGTGPEHGVSRDRRAQLTLSNGAKIFDISGNVWEHVKRNAANALVNNLPTDGGALGWRWIEHTAIVGYGDLSYDEVRPSNTAWNSTHGMGRVWTRNGADINRVLLRGGNWYSVADAGGFTLALGWDAASQGYNVGFRCAR